MTAGSRLSDDSYARLRTLVARDDAAVGLLIDTRYEVTHRMANGRMGEVFHARDNRLNRPVAMKVLAITGAGWAARFRAEALTTTKLEHPGVVPIHDLGTLPDGRLYYTMKYVSGRTFEELIDDGTARERLLSLLAEIGDIVQYAHERDVIHRDLKPSNIMVDEAGRVFVMDWGIAKSMEEIRTSGGEERSARDGLTSVGSVLGTIAYMSPEQAKGDSAQVDRRSDVYALGAILYRILTGSPPVQGTTTTSMLRSAVDPAPVPPRKRTPSIPDELEAICLKGLEADPARRYPTAAAFADDLRKYLQGRPVAAMPPALAYRLRKRLALSRAVVAAAAIGLAATLTVAAVFISQARVARDREKDFHGLMMRWSDLIVAKQGWYQSPKDPKKTRAQIEKAMEGLDPYILRHPDDPRGYYVRARGRLYLDDLEGACRDAETAVTREPSFAPGWALLGRVKMEQFWEATWSDQRGTPEALEKECRRAFEKSRQAGEGAPSGERWGLVMEEEGIAETVGRALADWYAGDPSRTRRTLEEAHRAAPSEEYCHLLGLLSEDKKESMRWHDEALRLRPHNAKAYFHRGTLKFLLRDHAGMIEDFSKALEIHPGWSEVYTNRSAAKAMAGDFEGAIEDATQALKLNPHDAFAYVNRSGARSKRKDFPGAIEDATEALKLNPRYGNALKNRAAARVMTGDLPGAAADYTEALAMYPGDADACASRGSVWAIMAQKEVPDAPALWRRAEEDLRKALEIGGEEWPKRTSVELRLKQVLDMRGR